MHKIYPKIPKNCKNHTFFQLPGKIKCQNKINQSRLIGFSMILGGYSLCSTPTLMNKFVIFLQLVRESSSWIHPIIVWIPLTRQQLTTTKIVVFPSSSLSSEVSGLALVHGTLPRTLASCYTSRFRITLEDGTPSFQQYHYRWRIDCRKVLFVLSRRDILPTGMKWNVSFCHVCISY